MVNEPPVNSIDIFQKELAEQLKVNKEGRAQRIELEDSLKMDPFIEHLYSEGEFEKLIFFETRKNNELLSQLIDILTQKHQGITNGSCLLTPIEPSDKYGINEKPVIQESDDLPSYAYKSDEPVDPVTGIQQTDSDCLSPAEKASVTPGRTRAGPGKPPATKRSR